MAEGGRREAKQQIRSSRTVRRVRGAVFMEGGEGTMFELKENNSLYIIENFFEKKK